VMTSTVESLAEREKSNQPIYAYSPQRLIN
jgi:hypothetical protein